METGQQGSPDGGATTRERAGGSVPPPGRESTGVTRVLLIANETVAAPGVRDRIKALAEHDRTAGRGAEVFVVAPALTTSAFKHVTGEVDDAIAAARERLDESVRALRDAGLAADGEVGDSDPNLALEDALRRFPADEVVIATHPKGRSKWLEQDVVKRASEGIGVPVTHVVVDMERGGAEVTDVEQAPASKPEDGRATAYELPRMPRRDVAAITVGVVGTILLGILAIICAGDISEEGMSAGCAIRIGLALAAFFVTVFHVAALFLFGTQGYRGRWDSFAANTMLYGVPPAIVVSLIVG